MPAFRLTMLLKVSPLTRSSLHCELKIDVSPDALPCGEGERRDSTWRCQISRALDSIPPGRRRVLRAFQAGEDCGSAGGLPVLETSPGGDPLLDLASNDYLGLSRHPEVVAAACAQIAAQGLGAGASRLVSGTPADPSAAGRGTGRVAGA